MPWNILENFWKRALNPDVVSVSDIDTTWDKEIETLYRLGISMEMALKYLYFEKPDQDSFKDWVRKNQKEVVVNVPEAYQEVLSEEDLAFWDKNGYVIVKNAVSKADCEETQQAIWEFLGMFPDKKESWYNRHNEQKGLMLTFSDHATLNKNRKSLRIQKAYEQLYGTTKIYKTIDKVSFNPPETDSFRFLGSSLHWDVSLKQPIPFSLQGLLYLTDCGADDGAFHCVPGFHREIESWLNSLPITENPRIKALESLKPIPITAKAGDFIIWHHALPHCASPNYGPSPRMVQYLTYLKEDYCASSEWI